MELELYTTVHPALAQALSTLSNESEHDLL